MSGKASGRMAGRLVSTVAMAACLALILLPIILIILGAMKNEREAADMSLTLPTEYRFLKNAKEVLASGNTLTGYLNSVVLACGVTATCLVLSFPAAFAVARRRTRGSGLLQVFFLLGIAIPANIVANFYLMRSLGLYGSLLSVVILQAVGMIPVAVILIMAYVKTIPHEIDESAIVEGCGTTRFLLEIFAPLCKPVLATCTVLVFLTSWNDFMTPLYFLTKARNYTVSLSLFYFIGTWSRIWNLVFMDVLLVSAPVVILYVFLQRYIIAGLTSGAVKG